MWKYNIQLRHFFDQFCILLFAFFFVIYFLDSFPLIRLAFYDWEYEDAQALQAIFGELNDKLGKNIIVLVFFGFNIPINVISDIIYYNISISDYKINNDHLFDLILAFLINFYTFTTYTI